MRDFSYIEFMVSPYESNPFKDLDKEERHQFILESIVGEDYKPDKLVKSAIETYETWLNDLSIGYRLLNSSLKASMELIKFLNQVDLSERTKSGYPVYKPADIANSLKQTREILSNLQKLRKDMYNELVEVKTKGQKNINPLEI